MKGRRLFCWIVTGILWISLVSGHEDAGAQGIEEDKRREIREIETRLSAEKERLEQVHAQEEDLLEILTELESGVARREEAVAGTREKVRETERAARELQNRLEAIERRTERSRQEVGGRLTALYKYAKRGYMRMLASARHPDEFRRSLKYARVIMGRDREMLQRLRQKQELYSEDMARAREELRRREEERERQSQRLAALERELEERVIKLMRLQKKRGFYETTVRELETAAKELKKTLHHIEKGAVGDERFVFQFEEAKGRLPLPLQGKIIRDEEILKAGRGTASSGIFVESGRDLAVRAVFPGRVDYSGVLKGYGEMIIINHGSRYFTISAFLSHRTKEEGEWVEAGEIIGQAARGKDSGEGRVYFELRRAGVRLDPIKWLQ